MLAAASAIISSLLATIRLPYLPSIRCKVSPSHTWILNSPCRTDLRTRVIVRRSLLTLLVLMINPVVQSLISIVPNNW